MLVDVHVTQENIEKGVSGTSLQCPINLALLALFPSKYISTTPYYIRFSINTAEQYLKVDGKSKLVKTPPIATEFIARFDKKLKCEPFSFSLDTEDLYE